MKNTGYILKLIWSEDKFLLLLLTAEALCSAFIPLLGIYLPKLVLDLLLSKAGSESIITRLGSFVLCLAAVYFIGRYAGSARYWRINTLRPILMLKIFLKSIYCDYGELESPEGQKRYQNALDSLRYGDGSATSRLVPALMELTVGILGFAAYSGILIALHPLIVLLLVISSVVVYLTLRRAVGYERSRKEENSALGKKITYISGKTADYQYGKDIRLYKAGRLLGMLRDSLIRALIRLSTQIQGKWLTANIVEAAVAFLRDGLAYVYLILMVTSGRMDIADFIFFFGAIAGFSGWLSAILKQANAVNGAQLELTDIREYLERGGGETADISATPGPSAPPSITFENVCFSYGPGGRRVLENLNLSVSPNEKIALVGVNGAGKTTLVKLLCGFYKPDSGRILIDGDDIQNIPKERLYGLLSAVFQDIMILPFSLAENTALRRKPLIDRARVAECLKKAGLWDHVQTLPDGLDTIMLRIQDEKGVIFSGGQQQKLLLARALYKDAPVLILDEPTAALDPIAESELYTQYNSLVRGKTAIYISHRLASTRFCDRIIYLSNGTAEEIGTHEELMRLGGGYASMFEVQSHYYKEQTEVTA